MSSETEDWPPRIARYEGIDVVPYPSPVIRATPIKGGPRWPDWEAPALGRWWRYGALYDLCPEPVEPEHVEPGHTWWAGPLHPHFGHFVGEFSLRLFALSQLDPGGSYVFAPSAALARKGVGALPKHVHEILDWFGISPGQIHLVDRPTRFEALSAIALPEHYGWVPSAGPSAAYLDRLTAHAARRLGPITQAGTVMVSRAGFGNSIAGERYLADLLAERGVRIYHPEDHSLIDQLRVYAGAERLLFSEGSPCHTLKLLGRGLGDVVVLGRWSELRTRYAMEPRCRSVTHLPPRWPGEKVWSAQGFYQTSRARPAHDAATLERCLALLGIDAAPLDRRRLEGEIRSGVRTTSLEVLDLPYSDGTRTAVDLAARLAVSSVPGGRGTAVRVLARHLRRRLSRGAARARQLLRRRAG